MVVAGRGGAVEARIVVFGQPVGEELFDGGGLDDGAGEDMCAQLAGFFEKEDPEVIVSGGGSELFEPDSGRETGGTYL